MPKTTKKPAEAATPKAYKFVVGKPEKEQYTEGEEVVEMLAIPVGIYAAPVVDGVEGTPELVETRRLGYRLDIDAADLMRELEAYKNNYLQEVELKEKNRDKDIAHENANKIIKDFETADIEIGDEKFKTIKEKEENA